MKEGLSMTLDVTKNDKINIYYKDKIIDYLISFAPIDGRIYEMKNIGIHEVIEQQAILDATSQYIKEKEQSSYITQNQKENLIALLYHFLIFSKNVPDETKQSWKEQIVNYMQNLNRIQPMSEKKYNTNETKMRYRKKMPFILYCITERIISYWKLCDLYLLYHLSDTTPFPEFYYSYLPNFIGDDEILASFLEFQTNCPEILQDSDVQTRIKKIIEFNKRAQKGKSLPFRYSKEEQEDARNILVKYLNHEVKKELYRSRKKD